MDVCVRLVIGLVCGALNLFVKSHVGMVPAQRLILVLVTLLGQIRQMALAILLCVTQSAKIVVRVL